MEDGLSSVFSGLKSVTRTEKQVVISSPYQKFQHLGSEAERGRGKAEKLQYSFLVVNEKNRNFQNDCLESCII